MSSNTTVSTAMPRLVLGAVLIAVVAVVIIREDTRVLSGAIGLTIYPNGSAMVQVPYRRDGAQGKVTIAVDFNGDGTFSADEGVADHAPALPERYWNSNYYFRREGLTSDNIRVKVVFTGAQGDEEIERKVAPTVSDDALSVSDFADVTKPELSMRQGVPDLAQRPDECAPTAAADALIWLAKEHGLDGKLPSDTLRMLDELKGDMRWTPSDGVLIDDFVAGSNLWALKKDLPVRTVKVGNQNGTRTLDALTHALASGSSALLRISYSVPVRGSLRVIGGHLVVVVGVETTDGKTYILVHDPRRPAGTDVLHIDGNKIIDYPYFSNDETTLSWGFVQSWIQ